MYRPGHTGAALFVYAPLGYALLIREYVTLAILGGGLVVALAMLPDIDLRIPGVGHRGSTHTLVFALCVGAAVGAFGWTLANAVGGASATIGESVSVRVGRISPTGLGVFGFLVGSIAVCSHLLADLVTPMGIKPFWPVSSKRFSLGIAKSSNTFANALLLALGVGVTLGALWLAGPAG